MIKSNSGDSNSGHRNSGDWNSGTANSGDWNSGSKNSGNGSSGSGNSGSGNSGYRNSGDWNSGNVNSGDWNSGNWNACDYETGAFNTKRSDTIRLFNKECGREEWENAEVPGFLYFDLCVWVSADDMTDEEKTKNPEFNVRGGYLKTLNYKEAFKKAWDDADEEDRQKLFDLPNFDAEVFKEISGIDVHADQDSCAGKVVEIDGKKYKLIQV